MTQGDHAPNAADLVLARDRLLGRGAGARSAGVSGHRLSQPALREALADLHEF